MKRIPSQILAPNYRYKIVDENDSDYQLQVSETLTFPIKKGIVRSNGLDTSNGSITLSKGLYEHHVKPRIEKLDEAASNQLLNNFALVMANANLVLSNPSFYLIRTPWLCSGGGMSGPINYCLGALLEEWLKNKRLLLVNKDGHKEYIIKVGGSLLSGMLIAKTWCPHTQSLGELYRDKIPGGLGVWLPKFAALSAKRTEKLPANYQSIYALLEACKKRMPVIKKNNKNK
jgi:hypothetical protein